MRRLKIILALLALLFGITAAFTDHQSRNRLYPDWKFQNKRTKAGKVSFISASHLADLLQQRSQGIRILDVRDEKAFSAYHIPSGISYRNNAPDSTILWSGKKEIPGREGITILYGTRDDPEVYRIVGTLDGHVYVVKDGIDGWYDLVLFPDFLKYKVRNSEHARAILRRSYFFGGTPGNSQLLNIAVRETRFREGC